MSRPSIVGGTIPCGRRSHAQLPSTEPLFSETAILVFKLLLDSAEYLPLLKSSRFALHTTVAGMPIIQSAYGTWRQRDMLKGRTSGRTTKGERIL
ncbi:hypothetical protein Tcan_10577 [Toxocara canis]|uniref:Uncharacterized protein n=1 Tax=Toxocara canis TaxID=6265 RepID=A0A0B2UUN2_TOXCA|nr:hypothetical protein Tcan_10577 [Toxocara canis]